MNHLRKLKVLMALVLFLGLSSVKLYSQAGGAAVPFLLISPDARHSGMGEVGTAIADDINAIYWNPAGLGFHDYYPKLEYHVADFFQDTDDIFDRFKE